MTIPSNRPFSDAINTIKKRGLVSLSKGKKHLVEIECDHKIQQQTADFRPNLPLIFYW
jgi:hypothetical protein